MTLLKLIPFPSLRVIPLTRRGLCAALMIVCLVLLFIGMLPTQNCPLPIRQPTQLLGGIPGFFVFAHVWYHNKTLYFFPNDITSIPDPTQILSGDLGVQVTLPSSTHHMVNIECLRGTSFFLNDGGLQGSWSYLNWYYHFAAEVLLGAFAALSSTSISSTGGFESPLEPPQVPDRIIIPWESNWRDGYGMNEMVVEGAMGANLIGTDAWERLDSRQAWVYLEKVVIVDRYASHRNNPLADRWNKMALPAFVLPHSSDLLFHARSAMQNTYAKAQDDPRRIKIVYIDRQASSRRLTEAGHQGLMEVLADLSRAGTADVIHAKLEDMDNAEQISAVNGANILLGIHGNGLTHMLWMPSGGAVIEIFTPDAFLRDYQVVAEVLGHTHVAVWDDKEYKRSEWELQKGELNPDYLHNGTAIPVDPYFIRTLLLDIVGLSENY